MKKNARVFLAVDLGASSGRVMAGRYDGAALTIEELHRFPNGPRQTADGYRWDMPRLFSEIETGLAGGVQRYGDSVVSLGVDTWGVDYGLLDEDGCLLDDPFAYRDPRTEGMMEEAFARLPKRRLYERTGIQFLPFNTVFQLLADRLSGSGRLAKARRLLFMPDLVNQRLCGAEVNEYTIASTSQLLDARTRTWAPEVLEALSLPARLLGSIVLPGADLGRWRGGVRVIAAAGHDTASAVAAVPFQGTRAAYLSSGTWSLMGIESPEPVIHDKTFDYGFTNEGGVGGTIRLLKNITGLWLIQECRRIWAEQGDALDYAEITRLAEEAEPFRSFIDPDDPVFAAPCDMPQHIRRFCEQSGQTVPESKGAIARAVYESLAFRCRDVFSMLEELAGERLEQLQVVGGGSQNHLLNRLLADALNRRVVAGPVEATALGNVLVQMMASGDTPSLQKGRELVRCSFPLETYEPTDAAAADTAYAHYQEVIRK